MMISEQVLLRHPRTSRRAARALMLLAVAALGGCWLGDGPTVPDGPGRVAVSSDPAGARILLDGHDTGRQTPDTVSGLLRTHDIAVRLDTLGVAYGFLARVEADADDVPEVHGPLVMRCATEVCWLGSHRTHTTAHTRFASNPVGSLFMRDGRGDGLVWPAGLRNSYVSGGMPVFAAVTETRDTVALGVYDLRYLAGRPVPAVTAEPTRFELRQGTWVLPPVEALPFRTARGLEVSQRVVATSAVEDVVVVELVFRNVSHRRAYQAADPLVPAAGVTYTDVFIGFALDPDIGAAGDDWISYAPDLDMVFAYDSDFRETGFEGDARTAPALVGLRVLERPPGTRVVLNGWAHGGGSGTADWRAGSVNERLGWGMLAGTQPYTPSHQDLRIGHLPAAPGDMRLSASVGPVRLAPGDSASVTLAVVLARPVPGTYLSGGIMQPGDPHNADRPLARAAAELFTTAHAAEAMLPLDEPDAEQ